MVLDNIPDGSTMYEKPQVECSWAPGENFTANFGNEVIEVSLYVDAPGLEGLNMNIGARVELYSDPYQGFEAVQQLEIIGTPDYYTNGCYGTGAILP